MDIRIDKIEGLDDLLKKIGALSLNKILNQAIRKSIFTTEREAKLVTPVDTGLLRNSYESNFQNLEGRLRNFREYGPIVDARTGFFSGTSQAMEPRIYEIFENEIQDFLNNLVD